MEEYLKVGTVILMTIAVVMATVALILGIIGLYKIIKDEFKTK